MKYGLISQLPARIARLLGLVHSVEAVRLDGEPRPQWALLVRGQGFTRLLRDEPLMSPYLLRTVDPTVPRPMRFLVRQAAERYGQSVGLMKRQMSWVVEQGAIPKSVIPEKVHLR